MAGEDVDEGGKGRSEGPAPGRCTPRHRRSSQTG